MDYFVHLYKYAVKIQTSLMYTNTLKNKLTTDQNGKLLLNTVGILFYCRNGTKSTAINVCKLYRVHYYVFFNLFDFILLCWDGLPRLNPY